MNLERAKQTFLEECRELLQQMESLLLQSEAGALDAEAHHALFRCVHTIKGSAGMFGLDATVSFAHVIEGVLERVRNGEQPLDAPLAALLLECRDHLATLVDAEARAQAAPEAPALLQRLAERQPATLALPVPAAAAKPILEARAGRVFDAGTLWHISLRFGPDMLRHGLDPLPFVRYLERHGELVHVQAVPDALPEWAEYDAEACYLGFEVALRSQADKATLESVFDIVSDDADVRIVPPANCIEEFVCRMDALPEGRLRLGELLVACGSLTPRELDTALAAQERTRQQQPQMAPKPIGQVLLDAGLVPPPVVHAALDKQRRTEQVLSKAARSLKVEAERLDALIDQVGELVIAGAATQALAQRAKQADMVESTAALLQLVEEVRDTALRLRMVQIGEVFGRFPRVVRDIARELGKDIDLVVSGAEAELDKSMVDKLGDPLTHLVRNAIDHGMEAPQDRASAGKPPRGTLRLNAYHESGSIVIEVADDGRGLDEQRILARALERGLVVPGHNPSRQEVFELILQPGFSTAEQVTNLSGRGVGMDVVRTSVEALRGTLHIDSKAGHGTTMRLCLPLTLAIIDGFRVSVGERNYIVPLDMVVECIERPARLQADCLDLRGEVLPVVRLRALFGDDAVAPRRSSVVVARFGGRKVGLEVDRLHGECQTVIKPLGRLFEHLSGISGSTILGSGEVALILDVPHLVQHAVRREQPASTASIHQGR